MGTIIRANEKYEPSTPTSPKPTSVSPLKISTNEKKPPGLMFGVDLATLMGPDGSKGIPIVISDTVAFVRANGLECEGIFRRSPSSQLLQAARESYDRGESGIDFESRGGIHMAAVLLKLFFREVPKPIFESGMYDIFRKIETINGGREAQLNFVKTTIFALLTLNELLLLRFVFELLHEIHLLSSKNLMTAHNLTIIWAPNLIRGGSPVVDMAMCTVGSGGGGVGTTVKLMIEEYPTVFGDIINSVSSAPQDLPSYDIASATSRPRKAENQKNRNSVLGEQDAAIDNVSKGLADTRLATASRGASSKEGLEDSVEQPSIGVGKPRRHAVPNVPINPISSFNFFATSNEVRTTQVPAMGHKRNGDEDEMAGIVKTLKRIKVNELDENQRVIVGSPAVNTNEDDLDDFEEVLAPVGQNEDDASDYFPSDIDEEDDRSTPASSHRRALRSRVIVESMTKHFMTMCPTPSRNINQGLGNLAPNWTARLRKYNHEEERWVEKGPVVIMLLPCREQSPWEARLVAHYSFGTQSAAINMPRKAIIEQEPRRLRDVLKVLTRRDAELLAIKEGNTKNNSSLNKATHMMMESDADGNNWPSAHTSAWTSDYLYECRTTVKGVKEEDGASLYVFIFPTTEDSKDFCQRYEKASKDYGRSLAELRLRTFLNPQPVQRLVAGHLVPAERGASTHLSPFSNNPPAATALAYHGLHFVPVSNDAVVGANLAGGMRFGTTPVTEYRFICWHCRASVSISVGMGGAPVCIPSVDRILKAHQSHPLAIRLLSKAHRESVHHAYLCPDAFKTGENGGYCSDLRDPPPSSRTRRANLDPIVLSTEE
ncbi:hypothetical protein HDU67_004116 [Dinochytrium kinnereticum]|nr:hypothetical protein HDU67_004116 [Dinochytrium kinnereticum]